MECLELAAAEGGLEVQVDGIVDEGVTGIEELPHRVAQHSAGIVDTDIESAELRHAGRKALAHGRRIANVQAD
jgi:hypothetical protein